MAGVITMDQLMVDCGPDSRVAVGDEAVLLGAQGDERISPDEWAARLDTFSYEIVCALAARVARRYVDPSDQPGALRRPVLLGSPTFRSQVLPPEPSRQHAQPGRPAPPGPDAGPSPPTP